MKGAGGASGPTRPAHTSTLGSGKSGRIGSVLKAAVLDGDAGTATFLRGELARRRVRLKGLPADDRRPSEGRGGVRVLLAKADPNNPNQIGNMTYDAASSRARASGDAKGGGPVHIAVVSPCHTDADGQMPKGPHLVDIGKRYSPAELVESILKPSAKLRRATRRTASRWPMAGWSAASS